MRNRNNEQICESQDVRVWETSKKHPHDVRTGEAPRVHQQNNWWPTNQAHTMSYLQLPPRRFQEQRQQVMNYEEEEDLSWCSKCGKPGHIQAFCAARVYCSFCRMKTHNNKVCWNQQRTERVGPVSSSRQTTPVQISERGGPRYNYGDHRNKQNMFTANQPELSSHPWEAHSAQAYTRELGSRQEKVVHDQIQYQRMLNRGQMIKEEDTQQQQVQSTAPQRKITKTQATQIHERERCENQSGQFTLRKPVHQGSIEEECLWREPFFVNHYYSHPVEQCCCQQCNVSMKEDQITVVKQEPAITSCTSQLRMEQMNMRRR